ncbi:AAA family ATPase [Lactococcus lactis subsp. lactis]|jgi:phage nucleotide-binding protein|uniref:Phage nucleotide-binding protein n=2 Tax=Lactococcus lactis TaxID=1358 RepID=A0A2N5W9N0_LACLL|nr:MULTISPECIES: AAA family ATPase [Lactococcus]KSU12990.1 Phage DNA-binding protein [Lactococcus lactis subsp. lactis]MBK5077054.1 AAA family ATPase [Lactococcus lactis]MBN2936803.1 AAA family ATPase [Lactococcus lactis]MCA2389924.1 AAA family ATPase [Lactococcus sp. NH2-7C]MCT1195493.1 DNA-binding protein [Lactococcus lactis]
MKITKATDISRTQYWRVLLYGKPGLGKTSAVKGLTGRTLVLSLDNSHKVLSGIPNIDVRTIDDEGLESFNRNEPIEDINIFLKELDVVISDYDNLVIDNVTSFQSDWLIERGRSSKGGIRNEIQDYGDWTNYFLRIMTKIYGLPINVYVTAWEDTQEISLEDGRVITQFVPKIRKQVLSELLGWTDVVGRIKVNPNTGNRGAILEGNDGVYAKNRIDSRTACPIDELFKFEGEK